MGSHSEADGRERILYLLKTKGPRSATWLGEKLGVTSMGARQHLQKLEEHGLVESTDDSSAPRTGPGRPARLWRLTAKANERFPEAYAELALELIATLRDSLGEAAVETFLEYRSRKMLAAYRSRLPDAKTPLSRRVAALARLRTGEGYMAESKSERDGSVLLIENHCPICVAAETCQGLCTSELDVFRASLGKSVSVEREEHMLSGSRRCVYRIKARGKSDPAR